MPKNETHRCEGMVRMDTRRSVQFDLQSVHQPALLHTFGLRGYIAVVVVAQELVSSPVYHMTMLHDSDENVIQSYLESVLSDIRELERYMPRLVIVKAPGEHRHDPHGCELVVSEPFSDVLDAFAQRARGLQVVIEPYFVGSKGVYNTGIAVKAAVFSDDGTAYVNYTGNKGKQHTLSIPMVHALAPAPAEELDEDTQHRVVIFQDENICILHPQCPHGILVRTRIPLDMIDTIHRDGLKSGLQLSSEGVQVRMFKWDCVFFQAPCSYVEPIHSDYFHTKDRAQVEEAYGRGSYDEPDYIYIRVDPEHTFVFSSEINAAFIKCRIPDMPTSIKYGNVFGRAAMEWLTHIRNASRKSLTRYLKIIQDNAIFMKDQMRAGEGMHLFHWNLYSSEVNVISHGQQTTYPYDIHDVSTLSEVHLRLGVVPPDWFVSHTSQSSPISILRALTPAPVLAPVLAKVSAVRGQCARCKVLNIWCHHRKEWV